MPETKAPSRSTGKPKRAIAPPHDKPSSRQSNGRMKRVKRVKRHRRRVAAAAPPIAEPSIDDSDLVAADDDGDVFPLSEESSESPMSDSVEENVDDNDEGGEVDFDEGDDDEDEEEPSSHRHGHRRSRHGHHRQDEQQQPVDPIEAEMEKAIRKAKLLARIAQLAKRGFAQPSGEMSYKTSEKELIIEVARMEVADRRTLRVMQGRSMFTYSVGGIEWLLEYIDSKQWLPIEFCMRGYTDHLKNEIHLFDDALEVGVEETIGSLHNYPWYVQLGSILAPSMMTYSGEQRRLRASQSRLYQQPSPSQPQSLQQLPQMQSPTQSQPLPSQKPPSHQPPEQPILANGGRMQPPGGGGMQPLSSGGRMQPPSGRGGMQPPRPNTEAAAAAFASSVVDEKNDLLSKQRRRLEVQAQRIEALEAERANLQTALGDQQREIARRDTELRQTRTLLSTLNDEDEDSGDNNDSLLDQPLLSQDRLQQTLTHSDAQSSFAPDDDEE